MIVDFKSYKKEVAEAVQGAIDKTLTAMGDKAVQLAQNYATVDTGNMRASITHQRYDDKTEIFGTSNSQAPIKPVKYAQYVELGTKRMKAPPFIRPAVERHRQDYISIIQENMKI